ncbi:MAG: ADP-ribosylglycohydrolase family protein [Polyangiaceae bacterium]
MPNRIARIEGALIGALVGDALGVPYEFHAPSDIPERSLIDMSPPAGFRRAHGRVPVGTYSDDGAQLLCLLASLLERGELDLDDFGGRLVSWYDWGYLAVDNVVFDVGIQTSRAIRSMMGGAAAHMAGPIDERANGNGSLMRVLPLALWHKGSDEELVRDAHLQSTVTHGHRRSQVCCALYCLWVRRVLAESPTPWVEAVEALRAVYGSEVSWLGELEWHIRPDDEPSGTGSGYVVDCLRSSRFAIESEATYEGALKFAIALGNDTDTTACVTGGIAGARQGIEAIPERWRAALRGRELIDPLVERLLAHVG